MALVAGDLIDEARDFHESFGEDRATNPVLLRALSRAEQSLYREIVHLSETALAEQTTLDEFDLQFAAGEGEHIELPAHLVVISLEATIDGRLVPVQVLHDNAGAFDPRGLVGRLIGRQLFLGPSPRTYPAGSAKYRSAYDWSDLEELRVTYVPHPPQLTSLTQELTAPDQTRSYLVAEVVAFLATRISLPESAALAATAQLQRDSVAHSFVDAVAGAHWSVTIV